LSHEAVEPASRARQCRCHIVEHAAVARDHDGGIEPLDEVQRGADLVERRFAFEFGEHHAKTVLPKRVSRHQRARGRLEQHHGMRVVAGRGVHLPQGGTQLARAAGLQRGLEAKTRALLARGAVTQGIGIPVAHLRRMPRRDGRQQAGVALLQCRIAAAVVAVQMGVEQALERRALQRMRDQRQRLLGMRAVPGIDQRGGAVTPVGGL
jgi:hypothetical protein